MEGCLTDLMAYWMDGYLDVFVIEWVGFGWMSDGMDGRLG
jgi:hypothetical protein